MRPIDDQAKPEQDVPEERTPEQRTSELRLEMREVSKSFPGVLAARRVSLSLRAGEVRGLVGENGAGKSTLMNVLAGVFTDYEGEILVDGRPVSVRSPREAQELGIAMIHQELNLVPELSVADNIFLGRERRTPWRSVDRARTDAAAAELLAELDVAIPPGRSVGQCRIAERQLIEVGKALSLQARILIMDEPTSALADAEAQQLFRVIRRLSARGVAVIYISHRLEELSAIAESISVMRDGELVETRPFAGVSQAEVIRLMVGRPLEDLYTRDELTIDASQTRLRVKRLSLRGDRSTGRQAVHDVSFDVHAGEIVGLAGLMGAGRTEVLETIFGVHPGRLVDGEMWLDDRPLTVRSPGKAIRRGVAFITEDRKGQSLVTQLSVRFNVTLSALARFTRAGLVDRRGEKQVVMQMIDELRIKAPGPEAIVDTLSGGTQQKVVVAKCLLTEPRLVLMDEPTRGIDVGAKAEIYALINRLAGSGAGILMVSSELPELLAMCDRILVLCGGRLTAEFERDQATQEQILQAAMPRETVLAHG
ncbi:MAG: sugar ABC transporter ATP-binding protein [Solirubrobacteraceae bacterium]